VATDPQPAREPRAELLLAVPELVALDLPALVSAAGYPWTAVIHALSSIASLLALKLVGMRRVSHVDDLAADLAAGLFAELVALVYANDDLAKATQANEVLAFCDHWRSVSGRDPQLLVFDSRVTTQSTLGALDARGVRFLILRMRTAALTAQIAALPASAWWTVALDRDGVDHKPQVAEEPRARLHAYPGTVRQLVVRGLGHEAPTILITNDRTVTAKALIERHVRRMTIEQRLAESIRSFHVDALASAVPLNVVLDVVLSSVLAGAVGASLRRRLSGYETAIPDTLQRRFLSTGGTILNHGDEIVVQLARRTYSPVLRAADLPQVAVPWWQGRRLRFEFA
jgi:hypothetical protein